LFALSVGVVREATFAVGRGCCSGFGMPFCFPSVGLSKIVLASVLVGAGWVVLAYVSVEAGGILLPSF